VPFWHTHAAFTLQDPVLAIIGVRDEVAFAACETAVRVVHVDARARTGELGGMTTACGGLAWIAPIGCRRADRERALGWHRPALARRASRRRPRKALGAGPFGPAPALSQHLPVFPGARYSATTLPPVVIMVFASVLKWPTTFCWFGCAPTAFLAAGCQSPLLHTAIDAVP